MRLRPLGLILSLLPGAALAQALQFSVTWSPEKLSAPFSGRVVVFFSKADSKEEPRFGPDWFEPQPMYSAFASQALPGHPFVIDDSNAIGFPGKLSQLKAGDYRIQAVVDRDLGGRAIGASAGNLYSAPMKVTLDPAKSGMISLMCDQVVEEPKFEETSAAKEIVFQSKLLSAFYHRPTMMRASIALPEEWAKEPNRKFPIVVDVPGFGGSHLQLSGLKAYRKSWFGGTPFLFVILNPNCPTGHCVFADSANNGPWGKALTTELIPYIEKKYRAIGKPGARYVTGHSSGGWSSLWLQVAYPDFFGGVWSTAPDPVDFHSFQYIDLYDPKSNMFTDAKGAPRPIARQGTQPWLFYKPFSDMERPIRGEQLGSFEAVFSERGLDGQPKKLWDRETGAIDQAVFKSWLKYDIARTLREHWATLGPKLKGKLHVYVGNEDTFYLEGAVHLLHDQMAKLGSDAKIEFFPGNHFTLITKELRNRMDSEMAAQFAAFERSEKH